MGEGGNKRTPFGQVTDSQIRVLMEIHRGEKVRDHSRRSPSVRRVIDKGFLDEDFRLTQKGRDFVQWWTRVRGPRVIQ